MMAVKAFVFNDSDTFGKIMAESHPKQQKALGREVRNYRQDIWDKLKFQIVLYGNIQKFEQNTHLKEFLMSFDEDTIFAEAAHWDKIWGIGLTPEDPRALDIDQWQGENLLGQVISKVRKTL